MYMTLTLLLSLLIDRYIIKKPNIFNVHEISVKSLLRTILVELRLRLLHSSQSCFMLRNRRKQMAHSAPPHFRVVRALSKGTKFGRHQLRIENIVWFFYPKIDGSSY
jgi:hypothetical protein